MIGVEPPGSLQEAFCFLDASRDGLHRRALVVHLARSVHNSLRSRGIFGSRSSVWSLALQRFRKLARDSPRERALLVRLGPSASPPVLAVR